MSSEMRDALLRIREAVTQEDESVFGHSQVSHGSGIPRAYSVRDNILCTIDREIALLARTEAGAVECSDCDGDGETCLAGRSAHRSNWIKCAKCNGTGVAAPVADGAVGYVSADGGVIWLTDGSYSLKPAAGTNLFTHPHDASVDELAAWRELGRCVFLGQPTWPNNWPQDVSIVGYSMHQKDMRNLEATDDMVKAAAKFAHDNDLPAKKFYRGIWKAMTAALPSPPKEKE